MNHEPLVLLDCLALFQIVCMIALVTVGGSILIVPYHFDECCNIFIFGISCFETGSQCAGKDRAC